MDALIPRQGIISSSRRKLLLNLMSDNGARGRGSYRAAFRGASEGLRGRGRGGYRPRGGGVREEGSYRPRGGGMREQSSYRARGGGVREDSGNARERREKAQEAEYLAQARALIRAQREERQAMQRQSEPEGSFEEEEEMEVRDSLTSCFHSSSRITTHVEGNIVNTRCGGGGCCRLRFISNIPEKYSLTVPKSPVLASTFLARLLSRK